jgi:hypothetical protein
MTSRTKVKIEIDMLTFKQLGSVPSSVFDSAVKENMFVFSFRMGVKDIELGRLFNVKVPQLPYTYEEVE